MRKIKLSFAAFVAVLTLLAESNATGKWTGEMAGRGGNMMPVTMNLKVDGAKLTGTVSGRNGDTEISDGKIDGQSVSFTIVREFNDNKITQTYQGKLNGDTMHFSVTMSGGPNGSGPAREFDVKRGS